MAQRVRACPRPFLEARLCWSPASDWYHTCPLSCATGQQIPKLVTHQGAVQELILALVSMHLAVSPVASAISAWRGQAC